MGVGLVGTPIWRTRTSARTSDQTALSLPFDGSRARLDSTRPSWTGSHNGGIRRGPIVGSHPVQARRVVQSWRNSDIRPAMDKSELFLIVVDDDRKQFTVKGPLADDWHRTPQLWLHSKKAVR